MPSLRLALGAYLVVAAALALVAGIGLLTGPYRAIERSDYMTYHMAARMVLDGDGACLYDTDCQAAAQEALIGEEPSFEGKLLPYTSPPWLAAVMAPLGGLSLAAGFAIFSTLGLAVLAVAAWRLGWGGSSTRLAAALLMLTAWPTVLGVVRGQATLLVAGLLGLSVALATYRSGAALGFSALKPTLGPLWGLWQVVRWHPRAVATALAVVAGLVVLAAIVVSPQAVLEYPGFLVSISGQDVPGVHVNEMVNWRGVAERIGAGGWLVVAGSVVTLGLAAAAWWRSEDRHLGAAAAFLATPLVLPHANQHEAILGFLGVLLLVRAAPAWRSWLIPTAVIFHAVLWSGPLIGAELESWLLFALLQGSLVAVVAVAWRPPTMPRSTSVT